MVAPVLETQKMNLVLAIGVGDNGSSPHATLPHGCTYDFGLALRYADLTLRPQLSAT
jgi:hypothetical protein